MSSLDERLEQAPQTLAALLARPFPTELAEPNTTYAWEFYQTFLADAPDRLIDVLCGDYHDSEADRWDNEDEEAEEPETLYDYEASYDRIYERAISAVEQVMGPAVRITGPSDSGEHFDDTLFNFDSSELAYWLHGDRIALIHYASHAGDGDFQLSVSAAVIPRRSGSSA
ncbi:hypothetical protein [Chitinimonas sp. JJ19]|uniref:hypothetical protein n=1 Tax=Chitinimonas sp. JJ19 TaxID=3109352 RepID=UPI0030030356